MKINLQRQLVEGSQISDLLKHALRQFYETLRDIQTPTSLIHNEEMRKRSREQSGSRYVANTTNKWMTFKLWTSNEKRECLKHKVTEVSIKHAHLKLTKVTIYWSIFMLYNVYEMYIKHDLLSRVKETNSTHIFYFFN